MIPKHFDQITKADIDALITNAVSEGKTLDYKLTLCGSTDSEKKEFLKDISSFANAAGGDILYGIEEVRDANGVPTGRPQAVQGLADINIDQEILRLDNLARTGIAPRIPSLQIKGIQGFPNGPILLIRILKSWAAPHMIIFQSESRFFSRTNAGKYPLDVVEIRSAFSLSDAFPERVRRFRDERLSRIIASETPAPLSPLPKTILHVLPAQALDPAFRINLSNIKQEPIVPINATVWSSHYNFDGFVFYESRRDQSYGSYVQIFRNGAIESATTHLFVERNAKGIGVIPNVGFEGRIIDALTCYLNIERKWNVMPPYFVMISLLEMKGFVISDRIQWSDDVCPIDRDVLLLPDVLVDDEANDTVTILRPIFDALWQASGLRGSMNYDQNGRWQPEDGRQ